MRRPRDYDAEMRTLNDRAKQLKERKVRQLGELVIACHADVLPIEQLAGALLAAIATTDVAVKEGWRKRGAAFFQHAARRAGNANHYKGNMATRDDDKERSGWRGISATSLHPRLPHGGALWNGPSAISSPRRHRAIWQKRFRANSRAPKISS